MSIAQKLNMQKSLGKMTDNRIAEASMVAGQVYPAQLIRRAGNMVVVRLLIDSGFTLTDITMPLFGPEYVRYPMQPGDKGICIPAATSIGSASGMSSETSAKLVTPLNLSAFTFLPVSNTAWSEVDRPEAVTIYGPEGVTLRDAGSNTTFTLSPNAVLITAVDSIQFAAAGTNFKLNATGWEIAGQNGSLTDSAGTTSPAFMALFAESLKNWLNDHSHFNGNDGDPTGRPTSSFVGNIVQ